MSEKIGRARSTKRIARLIVHIVTGAALLTGATIAAAHAAGAPSGPGFESGSLRIAFVDGSGSPQASPLLSIEGAYPGMSPRRTNLELRNTGSLAETYSVATRLHQPGPGSLNDVLVVTVENRSGVTVYHGDLSGLSFHDSAALTPGAVAHYTVRVAWPDTGSADDAYQGQSLSFDLHANAQAA